MQPELEIEKSQMEISNHLTAIQKDVLMQKSII